MNIVIREDLKAYIDPLTPEELDALERSILTEGCRDALVLWGDILVDGHNRYGICQKHGLPFQTVQNPRFQSIEDVYLWMIDQHLGRRSVSDFQRGVLALRKKALVAQRRAEALQQAAAANAPAEREAEIDAPVAGIGQTPEPLKSREDVARAARISSAQVVAIEKIQKQATPEVVAAVKSGTISINTAAAVASLPQEEQTAAAQAGKQELKQAAKRAREAKRKPRDESASDKSTPQAAPVAADVVDHSEELAQLRQRVITLENENASLRLQLAALQGGSAPATAPWESAPAV